VSRLISGSGGGRRLTTPKGRATRPTSDRTREGLFSSLISLRGSLAGLSFLDLYAGSGAVGLEAASRGAGPVTLVERDARVARVIRANITAVAATGVTVIEAKVERFLDGDPTPYDVVFLDPPYAEPVAGVLDRLVTCGWLAPEAVVCVERASRDGTLEWPAGLSPLRSRRYGDTTLWYGRAS
jgi:16S rRNA (guanine966-N2)-methyltransferase